MAALVVNEMISGMRLFFAIIAVDVAVRLTVLFGHFVLRQGKINSFKVPVRNIGES